VARPWLLQLSQLARRSLPPPPPPPPPGHRDHSSSSTAELQRLLAEYGWNGTLLEQDVAPKTWPVQLTTLYSATIKLAAHWSLAKAEFCYSTVLQDVVSCIHCSVSHSQLTVLWWSVVVRRTVRKLLHKQWMLFYSLFSLMLQSSIDPLSGMV
jgi:hypothetical protein